MKTPEGLCESMSPGLLLARSWLCRSMPCRVPLFPGSLGWLLPSPVDRWPLSTTGIRAGPSSCQGVLGNRCRCRISALKVSRRELRRRRTDQRLPRVFSKQPLTCDFDPSGRQDLNLRPLDPQSSALPNCATSRVLTRALADYRTSPADTEPCWGRGRTDKSCASPTLALLLDPHRHLDRGPDEAELLAQPPFDESPVASLDEPASE